VRRELIIGFALIAAVQDVASARTFRYMLEHEGRAVGTVIYERVEVGNRVRTWESLSISLQSSTGRQLLRVERTWDETREGQPLDFTQRVIAGTASQSISAHVRGNELVVTRRLGDQAKTTTSAVPPALVFPAALATRIEAQATHGEWVLRYHELAMDTGAPELVELRARAPIGTADEAELEKREADAPDGRLVTWQRDSGRLAEPISFWGMALVERACTTACTRPRESLALLDGALVASPYRIPASAKHAKLRYLFELPEGQDTIFPATSEQVVNVRGRRVVLTICADCGSEAAPSEATLAHYRKPNPWIESGHPRIRALARRAPGSANIDTRMHNLVKEVQHHMRGTTDYVGYATALEAEASHNGDCTEFALLLAAVARASGLSARVVSGLAYSGRFTRRYDVFSPHAWVQVWDGKRWASYDAGLGEFDSTHIALAIGDGSPADFRGVMASIRGLKLVDAGQIANAPAQPAPR
jgi:Transglutaminase-like superfamily